MASSGGPRITTQSLPLFLADYQAAGGNVTALVERHGLSTDLPLSGEASVPLDALVSITDEIAAFVKDPFHGLHLAARQSRGAFGLLEFVTRTAPTFRHAMQRLVRYSTLLNDVARFRFVETANGALLSQSVEGRRSCTGIQPGYFFVTIVVRIARDIVQSDWVPREVGVVAPCPADQSELRDFFGCPIVFEAGRNYVEATTADLDRHSATGDPALHAVLDSQAQRVAPPLPSDSPELLDELRRRIRAAFEDGPPKLDAVAVALGMSARTLQRRLTGDGTSFNAIVDDEREKLARHYMADPSRSLGQIAFVLGFSELSAFTRAFRRWTGMSPGQFRRRPPS